MTVKIGFSKFLSTIEMFFKRGQAGDDDLMYIILPGNY